MLEIEKRAQLQTAEVQPTLKVLTNKFGQPELSKFYTVLFRQGDLYQRIRAFSDQPNKLVLTLKSGEMGAVAREEINTIYPKAEIPALMARIQSLNFREFISFNSQRYTFPTEAGLKAELTDHSEWGIFLEVEGMTEAATRESLVAGITHKIDTIFAELGLTTMSPEENKAHADEIFQRFKQPIAKLNLSRHQ